MSERMTNERGSWTRAGRRRTLWGISAAVLAPLVVMLALQYRWLADLERTSSVARQSALQGHADAVVEKVRHFYAHRAERLLDVPAWMVDQDCHRKLGTFFQQRPDAGVRQLFVMTHLEDRPDTVYTYQPYDHTLALAPPGKETDAIYLAVARWQSAAEKGLEGAGMLRVEEREPDDPIVLKAIFDDRDELVGFAGMVIDRGHFVAEVLPAIIAQVLPPDVQRGVALAVHDPWGQPILAPPEDAATDGREVRGAFDFVFTGWTLGLRHRGATPEQWARANFLFNISLSALLAVVLLGGVVLVLRTAARELRLAAMKQELVSNVSHELRTPLASIRVFGELMRHGRVEEQGKIRAFGEHIETESRRLTQLIDNILDFSHIDAGRKRYRFRPMDVKALVGSVVAGFEVRLGSAGRIELTSPAATLPLVADADALAQAVSNLLDNAIKYSPPPPQVAVGLAGTDQEVILSVTDRGIGIDLAEQEKIFERFHRVGNSLVHDVKGSGLGLAIVRHIATAHRGTVEVESAPGRGSTFTLRLPRVHPAAADAVPQPSPTTSAAGISPRQESAEAW